MIRHISNYATLIFDCDGVILNSNHIKTEAFRSTALPWGEDVADALVAYHVANGGVSRYRKFAYFLENILSHNLPSDVSGFDDPVLEELLHTYATEVQRGLMDCPVAEGLDDLRRLTIDANWCIVSGGDQAELRDIFSVRKLDHFFERRIYGSPDNKDTILARELDVGSIRLPALFLGDSRYDHQASTRAGLDFIFVSGWTDLVDWESYIAAHNLLSVDHLRDLLSALYI